MIVWGAFPWQLLQHRQGGAVFIEEEFAGGLHFDGFCETNDGVNQREMDAARLLAGFEGDPLPALAALPGGLGEATFGTGGFAGLDGGDAKLGGFLDEPLKVVELEEGGDEGDGDRGRGRVEGFLDFEGDERLAGDGDLGQVEVLVVGEFVKLARFGAEDADEMLGVGAGEFGGAAANCGDKEAASGHQPSFYETNFGGNVCGCKGLGAKWGKCGTKPRVMGGLGSFVHFSINWLTMTFWAHSDRDGLPPGAPGAKWQTLCEHLTNVSDLAEQLARHAAPDYVHFQELARWSGMLHDYGKYTDCFQERITTGKGKCPHAIHGAAMAFGGSKSDPLGLQAPHIGLAIAGHHAGMPDFDCFRDRANQSRKEAVELLSRASRDLPAIGNLLQAGARELEKVGGRFDLFTRMLFSCLVDADRLDTAGRSSMQAPLQGAKRLHILLEHIAQLTGGSENVKQARREVLEDCLTAAEFPQQLLSLSVPTGGGKTLSAMAFALKRAAMKPEQYRRIIVVIPYLSIIEQNAEVYSKIFGNEAILEHHSGSFAPLAERDPKHFAPMQEGEDLYQQGGQRPETENWDAPFVVTTSVRFFESLFSNHPSDLRRVHNIARSIVILDEVQVLPRPLLGPLLGMMEELSKDWGCTFVMSTATKPGFQKAAEAERKDCRWETGTVREIVRAPATLHSRLRRVTIDWRIRETVDWPEVADWMLGEKQALCVVNIRDHAVQLLDKLQGAGKDDGALFHLSTRMCPAHRLDVLAEIRKRLKGNESCLVVSTQLIEAGVDVDFPVAFRALGPLDSIVQVAGRADREGLLTDSLGKPGGRLVVFKPVDHRMPPNEYEHAAGTTEALAAGRSIQPDDLEAMANFFERYYGEADLGTSLLELRNRFKFASLADQFEMISSRTQDVFVPYGEGRIFIDELYAIGQLTGELRRKLQRYRIGLQPWEFKEAQRAGVCELRPASNVWIAGDTLYDLQKGLRFFKKSHTL